MTFETWFQTQCANIPLSSASAVLELVSEGATVPFIARYRKEKTGKLDEVGIQEVIEKKETWDAIVQRQAFIVGEIDRQKKLTPELKDQILKTFQLEVLEDLYLPYKVKRKTKAATAKDAGLEPLADWIWNCGHGTETAHPGQTLEIWAFTFRNDAKDIPDAAAAIAGAQDILIERLAEMQDLRQKVRSTLFEKGLLKTAQGKKGAANSKFENYFNYSETVPSLMQPQNSHRYLAIKRGWTEEELTLALEGPSDPIPFDDQMIQLFESIACSVPDSPGAAVLSKAARFAYKVHVFPSIENEVHKALKEVADKSAIQVFVDNARKILLASPYGSKSVLGVDPGIRTGCKLAVVNESGKFIADTVVYLNSEDGKQKAKGLITEIVKTGQLSAVAVGNGTAGRETETFIRGVLKEAGLNTPVIMVSESGASVYSASEAAREEFPELDVTVRGAISIARRLQDPLAELVKVDPKSIGVGQYQHDVSPQALKRSLGSVVESCVNQVGVDLNTASYHLLAYVSGIGPSLAKSLVEFRNHKGLFKSRNDLLEVPRFSKKIFEQAAGFLRIQGAAETGNPLDNTGVHPENYPKLESAAAKAGKSVRDFIGPGVKFLKEIQGIKEEIGPFTFDDIVRELEKPGRDPRDQFSVFQFRDDIHELKDLKSGMICPGIVTNVTNFGAFVDIGVHQDGLVHLSQISDKFVKDPKDVVSPGDQVKVRVLEVNLEKSQISLSMKNTVEKSERPRPTPSGNPSAAQIRPLKSPHTGPQKSAFSNQGGRDQGRDNRSSGSPAGGPGRSDRPFPKAQERIAPKKPKEAFNNAFAGLASLRSTLKPKS